MARGFLSEHRDGLPMAVVRDAALLVTELVTNAVLHGQPPISLTLTVSSRTIEASIIDAGSGMPLLDTRPVSASQLHGRGLQIVDALAAAWGIETGRDGYGTRVWFRLTTTDPLPKRQRGDQDGPT